MADELHQTTETALEKAVLDILAMFDDGPRFCTGTLSSGELVWKGSFIHFMERARVALRPEVRND